MLFIIGLVVGLAAWGSYVGVTTMLNKPPKLRHRPEQTKPVSRVLIRGAGRMGDIAYHHILNCRSHVFEIVGYIDNNASLKGSMLYNVPVLGTDRQLAKIIREYDIQVVFGAVKEPDPDCTRKVEQVCSSSSVKYTDLSKHILETEEIMDATANSAFMADASPA